MRPITRRQMLRWSSSALAIGAGAALGPGIALAACRGAETGDGPTVGTAAAPAGGDVAPGAAAARFVAERTSDAAVALVAAVRRTGDGTFGAHLLDLVRIGFSSAAAEHALDGLAELSGIARRGGAIGDYLQYGDWVQHRAPEPARGYQEFKAAVYYQVDDDFVPLLTQLDDARLAAALQWGGVAVGAIEDLRQPRRAAATAIEWAEPEEQLFTLVGAAGTVLAYPERIIARHELANDTLDGLPIAVSFCTLCHAARAFDRRVDGRTLTFRTSGLLLASNKVMVDDETSTLWQQLTGEALGGPLAGAQLVELELASTDWATWSAAHPTGSVVERPHPTVIDRETGVPIGYDYLPDAALADYTATEGLWYPAAATPPGPLRAKAVVATLTVQGAHLAVGLEELAAAGAIELVLGGHRLRLERAVRGVTVTDLTIGRPVIAGQAYWFAWYGAHPDTAVWPSA
ncbi:MAG: DUF3179 domain-containing (seleno)protein [Acidimicrobiales bacterium]